MSRRSLSILIPVVIIFAFLFGMQVGKLYTNTSDSQTGAHMLSSFIDSSTPRSDKPSLSLFWDVWDRLHTQYVDPKALDSEQMLYGAIKGMVASLEDPYTVFMDPNESKEFKNNLQGTLEGIGAELTVKDKSLTVMNVLKGSPAEKAGLKTNDIILEIDDEIATDMTIYQAITKIRGTKGTPVKLFIFRKDKSDPFEVTITRDTIRLDSITFEDKGAGIFYIGLHQFTDSTKLEMEDAISKIVLKDPKGIVLDLRNNGGGYLEVAIDVLSELLSGKKEVVTIHKRDVKDDVKRYTSDSGRLANIPLVVLINNASASASEIVAGAVQDLKRGTVMGEKSYGKGSVQEIEDNLEHSASLRITIAKWLTPLHRSIDKVGIEPDKAVKLTEEDLKKNRDPQLDAAMKILKK